MLDQRPALLDDDAHVCLIHNDEAARTRHAVDFIRAAARRGARTLYVSDGRDAREVMAVLDGHEARGDPLRRSGRLALRSPEDSYLADGRFDPESVVGWLREEAGRAQADGCAGLCVTG